MLLVALLPLALASGPDLPPLVTAPRSWSDVATLSNVAARGNSEGQTFGFTNEFTKRWSLATLAIKAGAIRSESTNVSRAAFGTSAKDYQLVEKRATTTTAETYFLNARYDYRLKDKDRWYWYGGTGWERNRPAGLNNRETFTAGVGRILMDAPHTKWRMDAGLGATHEEPLIPPPGFRSTFSTANLTTAMKHRFGPAAEYNLDLALTDNLEDRGDYLGQLKQAVTVSMTKRLGLKIGLDLAYRNHPNLIAVPLFGLADPPESLGQVSILAKKLDTVTTTSLVITF